MSISLGRIRNLGASPGHIGDGGQTRPFLAGLLGN